ncbi:MAG: AAA family ATPase [Chloroflexota bacterium]|nr:AAA family ATPase [Chloroflexota bacterium]MDE2947718.1 AAA family ATPase [Chloroflexota bacterium]
MVEKRPIDKLTIKGFKTLKDVEIELGKLNVLIGPNGGGKSNFVSYFHMLREMIDGRLQVWVAKRGGADRVLSFGAKETLRFSSCIEFGDYAYCFTLESADDERLVFRDESLRFRKVPSESITIGDEGNRESRIKEKIQPGESHEANDNWTSIANWVIYHFHDTSETAWVRRTSDLYGYNYLRPDASNLAAYLFGLREFHTATYSEICNIVRLAIPFFNDFVLEPKMIKPGEYTIQLWWRQHDSDYEFSPSQLSDGSLRFICLVTALMQPDPPSAIIIDEPELGLHPYAITLLGSLLESASERMQVIVATQSPQLLDEFSVDDLIVVELEDGVSVFKRLKESDFNVWLRDYSVGELWDKNVLGGGLP